MLTDQHSLAARATESLRLERVIAVGVLAGLIGWVSGGHAVAVPIAVVAIISVQAAICDARRRTIPNALIAAGLITVVVSVPFVTVMDHRFLPGVLASVAAGWLLAGSPLLFVLWLLRPVSIGGGDWKLLSVQSATIGLLAPWVAPLIVLGGSVGGLLYRGVRRQVREVPLGPGLAAGYFAAIAAVLVFPDLYGGPYT